ncbi:MAG: hypothetical protein BroJett040_00720 [Oligoflexia bacterium]|nr:MAG: hypothetical protein BroJett040_00720 [Oligoflexia bacterium]
MADRFKIWTGNVDSSGSILEQNHVGFAFNRRGSTSFRIKLWMLLNQSYYLVPTKEDQVKFNLYTIEEREFETKEVKTFWNKVGEGELYGNYIRLRFHLLEKELFLCLFDEKENLSELEVA